jgi:hypothetical protein
MSAPAVELYRHASMRAFLVADVLIYLDHSPTPPPVSAWSEYLASISGKLAQISRCLIVPSRGGLSAHQREQVRRLLGSRPTAVLTDSVINRGIITSLTWFGVSIHAFRPGEYQAALVWLKREGVLAEVLAAVGARGEQPREAAGRG